MDAYISKYQKLNNKQKNTFYNDNKNKIERYKTLHNHFVELRDDGVDLKSKVWQKTRSTLIDDNKLCSLQMKALKEEIGTAERIQKLIDAEIKEQNQVKDKKRVTENEVNIYFKQVNVLKYKCCFIFYNIIKTVRGV